MHTIQILPASVVTVEEYRQLRLEALQKEPHAFASSYTDQKNLPLEHWKHYLQNYRDGEKSWMMFAKKNDTLVGMCGAYQDENSHTAHIIAVYVKEEERGKKIGTLLLHSLLQTLGKIKTITTLMIDVNAIQTSAIQLYKKFGFQIEKSEEIVLGDGNLHKVYTMNNNL